MGLLDDAIREHLDLKRQRGADPGEIERLEREALGPVRRDRAGRGAGAVPLLEVNADPERDFEPATELLQQDVPVQEPKRGFLRRHRSPPTPRASDFTDHLDAGMDDDPFAHQDPFGQDAFDHDDPFREDHLAHADQAVHDGQLADGEPLVPAQDDLGHAHLDDYGQSAAEARPADEGALEHEDPATHEHSVPGPGGPMPVDDRAATAVEPAVGAESVRQTSDSIPPPPRRPSFAPVPPSAPEPAPSVVDTADGGAEAEFEEGGATPPDARTASTDSERPLDQRARSDEARETREWSVEEAFAAEDSGQADPLPEPAEEDVLEETPEFLQDTPDHDRLWFEQRPPRDFDFDG